ncbi:hypothetical protein PV328_002171 [Microctonus aethiopoides]|uniref:EamA domain-containing protein n=1 Tax=Microctonus aethiopoides TaxID=144406 RepID=A0AA39KYD2_9HYME|nr:hypothetical protein PV328_002171 [Microctonus aethiopoides]
MSCSIELWQHNSPIMAIDDPHNHHHHHHHQYQHRRLAAIMNKSQRLVLGLLILLLIDIIWVSSTELTKYVYRETTFNKKPFFSTYVKISMFTLYMLGLCFWPPWRDQYNKPANYMFIDPDAQDDNFYSEPAVTIDASLSDPTFVPIKKPDNCDRSQSGTESDDSCMRAVRFSKMAEVRHMSENDATEALLARLGYQASIRAGEHARRQAHKFSIQQIAKFALVFGFLLFVAHYTYENSLAQKTETETEIITVLSSSTSGLFTLILATIFPSNNGDKLTLSKLVAVTASIFGLVMVGLADLSVKTTRGIIPTAGIIFTLISTFFYATYTVLLKRKVDHEDRMDIPIFFGFVGLFNLILLWPLFFILHYGHWEEFEWPNSRQWTFLIINGLIGTVLSQVLWLWACFLTSSLIATMAVSLSMPMSMIADVLLEKVEYPPIIYFGIIPIILAFITICFLAHYDNRDPVMDLLEYLYSWMFQRHRTARMPDLEAEQTESLIGINSDDHEA